MLEQVGISVGRMVQNVVNFIQNNLIQRQRVPIKPRPLLHFMPGQIVFYITYRDSLDNEVVNQLRGRAELHIENAEFNNLLAYALNNPLKHRVLHRPTINADGIQTARVVVDLGLTNSNKGISDLFKVVDELIQNVRNANGEDLTNQVAQNGSAENEVQVKIKPPLIPINPISLPDNVNFRIDSVDFNWLSSSAQGFGSTGGGPGARPVPTVATAHLVDASESLTRDFAQVLHGVHVLRTDSEVKTPEVVEIAILDTAPPLHTLAAKYDEFVLKSASPHSILRDLLGNGGNRFDSELSKDGNFLTVSKHNESDQEVPFRISYNLMRDGDSRLLMDKLNDHLTNLVIENHPYKVFDHGLFIAGNISRLLRDAAPDVNFRIHLIQVLGDYGIGTTESLEHGLAWALESGRREQRVALIINCSLMLNAPYDENHYFQFDGLRLDEEAERIRRTMHKQEEMEHRMTQLEIAFNHAEQHPGYVQGVNIVAAAGNDSFSPILDDKPNARFPAAFEQITGVGALNSALNGFVPYTNRPDQPQSIGKTALGGEVHSQPYVRSSNPRLQEWITDSSNGLSGVYIGDFPAQVNGVPVSSADGWARWAGTSFASPRVVAALAILRARGINSVDAVNDIPRLV